MEQKANYGVDLGNSERSKRCNILEAHMLDRDTFGAEYEISKSSSREKYKNWELNKRQQRSERIKEYRKKMKP